MVKTPQDEELVRKIQSCLDEAESQDFIDRYSMSLNDLMDNSYEILEFRFDEDEINELPEELLKSVFWDWMA